MKKTFLIKDDFVNLRLDRWFKKNISDVPQSLIEKNIRKGNIKINNVHINLGKKIKLLFIILILNQAHIKRRLKNTKLLNRIFLVLPICFLKIMKTLLL